MIKRGVCEIKKSVEGLIPHFFESLCTSELQFLPAGLSDLTHPQVVRSSPSLWYSMSKPSKPSWKVNQSPEIIIESTAVRRGSAESSHCWLSCKLGDKGKRFMPLIPLFDVYILYFFWSLSFWGLCWMLGCVIGFSSLSFWVIGGFLLSLTACSHKWSFEPDYVSYEWNKPWS